MAEYQVNKGIGKSVEFQGLTMKYIYILAGGLIAIFILFVVMSIAGLPNSVSLSIAAIATAVLLWQTFALSKRYGEHGAMKRQARSYHPHYIINRVKFQKLFTNASNAKSNNTTK